MAESWRNILERAADNLSIELDRRPAQSNGRPQSYRQPQPAMRRPAAPSVTVHSFARSRDMLARELQAVCEPPQERVRPSPPPVAAPKPPQTLPVPVKQVRRAPEPAPLRKRSAWRNVLVIVVSAGVTGAAAYPVLGPKAFNLKAPPVEASARAAGIPDAAPVKSAPPVALSRQTEDALMERASNQMRHGDGAGARAVYEVLAHYGSPTGTFSLAATYDPAILAKRPTKGLAPDLAMARQWYSKAAELGSMTAYARLKEIDRQDGSRR